jgi:hypothetical protein
MDESFVKQLKRITDMMRDNWSSENNFIDVRNTFKDIEQAEKNLDFLMMAP